LLFLKPGRCSASATTLEVYVTAVGIKAETLWVYDGCWIDNFWDSHTQGTVPAGRILKGSSTSEVGSITNKICADFCVGYGYFAVEHYK
jgi:hypothetical protein